MSGKVHVMCTFSGRRRSAQTERHYFVEMERKYQFVVDLLQCAGPERHALLNFTFEG